jgi:hypothetical protein
MYRKARYKNFRFKHQLPLWDIHKYYKVCWKEKVHIVCLRPEELGTSKTGHGLCLQTEELDSSRTGKHYQLPLH